MSTLKTITLAGLLAVSAGAQAQNDDIENGLVVGEMAGACRIIKQLVFSEATRLPGGEEFVVRFMDTEAARLGWTTLELVHACKQAAQVYAEFTAEPTPASAPTVAPSPGKFLIYDDEPPAATTNGILAGPAAPSSRRIP